MAAITIPQTGELAGTIITNVRDRIPDPVYAGSTPQPDSDGQDFRAQTLYRWLTRCINHVAGQLAWTVEDWWAMPLEVNQRIYTLDARWHSVLEMWTNQYLLGTLDERHIIWPSTSTPASGQASHYDIHRNVGPIDITLDFAPDASDPVTTLNTGVGGLGSMATTITVASTARFLPYGWLQIGNELVQYAGVTTFTVTGVRRGRAGTTGAQHENSEPVTHCGLWIKGKRTPNPVTQSTDVIELPKIAMEAVELRLLAYIREAEQSAQEAMMLRKESDAMCMEILARPEWRQVSHTQAPAYGGEGMGGLYWYDGIDGVIVT